MRMNCSNLQIVEIEDKYNYMECRTADVYVIVPRVTNNFNINYIIVTLYILVMCNIYYGSVWAIPTVTIRYSHRQEYGLVYVIT